MARCRQIEALQAEVAALKAQLVGAGLAPALPDADSSVRRTNLPSTRPTSCRRASAPNATLACGLVLMIRQDRPSPSRARR